MRASAPPASGKRASPRHRASSLEISPAAAALIHRMITRVCGIEGIRVTPGPSESMNGAGPPVGIVVTPASGPLGDDRTVLKDGIAVFVDSKLAGALEGKLLDFVPVGSDQLRFTLTERSKL